MMGATPKTPTTQRGFLRSLARDVRGNVLAISAAAMIPMAGLVGGAIDISRLYITKTRLQHACDAGALAGRKAMGGGTWAQSSGRPNTIALQFFDGNFLNGSYGSTGRTRNFTESAGKVTGTASATVPMTLTRVIGRTTETLTVSCDAEMRLPNTDVMFVLDTTGSMGDTPSGDSQTKMASLKESVKCFYEIVARIDTDATCTTGTPSGGTGTQTQIRFGFVPYATNVNVGKLLPTAWFADSWDYQTREAIFTPQTTTNWTNGSQNQVGAGSITEEDPDNRWSTQTTTFGTTTEWCTDNVPADNGHTLTGSESGAINSNTVTNGNTRTTTWQTEQDGYYYEWRATFRSSDGRCRHQRSRVDYVFVRNYSQTDSGVTTTINVFSNWRYNKLPVNISLLKNGTNWNSSFQWPIGTNGANTTINWDGCVEERATVTQASYSPIPSGAKDLDLDSVPVAGDVTTQWKPVLPGVVKTRNGSYSSWSRSMIETSSDYSNSSSYTCPLEARKLQAWPSATDFDDYVDQLGTSGNTYHDIGLIWGGRLVSPTGLFASENALTPQGGEIERHVIFMTDGDTCTNDSNYQAYGIAWYDRRTTDPNAVPTDGCTDTGTLTQQVNARTAALCTAIKNKNITLWVITFGTLSSSTVTRMTACATTGRYFNATNAATLQSTFASIANQISQLRLTR